MKMIEDWLNYAQLDEVNGSINFSHSMLRTTATKVVEARDRQRLLTFILMETPNDSKVAAVFDLK